MASKRARGDNGAHAKAGDDFMPWNNFVRPTLTDLYQVTMAYSYWRNKKRLTSLIADVTTCSDDVAVFDLYFRKNPFGGEFTIFAGLEDCLRFLNAFQFTDRGVQMKCC